MQHLIQLTDLHINSIGEDTKGVNVRQNFLDLLQQIRRRNPHLLVLSGDLCLNNGDLAVYEWIKNHLGEAKLNYTIIPGNHDDVKMLRTVFPQIPSSGSSGELYFKNEEGFLFLDSSKATMSERQYEWIEKQISSSKLNPLTIFVHHPILPVGVPYMDNNHAFREMKRLTQILHRYPDPINVFSGHYHVERVIHHHNINLHLCPSVYFQINWRIQEFAVEHYFVGFREIFIRDNGAVSTTVVYQPGNRLFER